MLVEKDLLSALAVFGLTSMGWLYWLTMTHKKKNHPGCNDCDAVAAAAESPQHDNQHSNQHHQQQQRQRRRHAVVPASSTPNEQIKTGAFLPTNQDDEELVRIRHSSAHVLAMAVQQIYPEAQVTIGPWIEHGFYFDFYFPDTIDRETGEILVPGRKLVDADLKKIKKAMDKIIHKNFPIELVEVTRQEAARRIQATGEPFKLEILESIQEEPITIYTIGDQWWDLCAGPHVASTGELPAKAIALTSVAGAYWRGDETREMLQRVYATAWKDPAQLKQYKRMMEEAKKRDYRILGKKVDLFSIQQDAGRGWVGPTLPISTSGRRPGISSFTGLTCLIQW